MSGKAGAGEKTPEGEARPSDAAPAARDAWRGWWWWRTNLIGAVVLSNLLSPGSWNWWIERRADEEQAGRRRGRQLAAEDEWEGWDVHDEDGVVPDHLLLHCRVERLPNSHLPHAE